MDNSVWIAKRRLGISGTLTPERVTQARRVLARLNHPDCTGGVIGKDEAMTLINSAADTLLKFLRENKTAGIVKPQDPETTLTLAQQHLKSRTINEPTIDKRRQPICLLLSVPSSRLRAKSKPVEPRSVGFDLRNAASAAYESVREITSGATCQPILDLVI